MEKANLLQHDASSEQKRPTLLLLSQWAPITTRLLSTGGESAWNILDGVMGGESREGLSFVDRLNQELNTSGLVKGLLPARTTGDVRLAELMSILETTAVTRQVSQSLETTPEYDQGAASPTDNRSRNDTRGLDHHTSRGDQSLFIDRTLVSFRETARIV